MGFQTAPRSRSKQTEDNAAAIPASLLSLPQQHRNMSDRVQEPSIKFGNLLASPYLKTDVVAMSWSTTYSLLLSIYIFRHLIYTKNLHPSCPTVAFTIKYQTRNPSWLTSKQQRWSKQMFLHFCFILVVGMVILPCVGGGFVEFGTY